MGSYVEYMSQEGYDKLASELRKLSDVDLARVKDAIAEARAMGDLSENFEYHAAKREQGRILGRIRFLQRVLENARVLDESLLQNDTVRLLNKVGLTNLNNDSKTTYIIVNPHEADIRENKISVNSPVAKALLNRAVGDVVEVSVPAGVIRLRIDSIEL